MQELLIHRSNLPYFLPLFVTLFLNALSWAFRTLVGEVSVCCVGRDVLTFSSLRMEISLSQHRTNSLIALLVCSLPYFISVCDLWVPGLDVFGSGAAGGMQIQSSFSPLLPEVLLCSCSRCFSAYLCVGSSDHDFLPPNTLGLAAFSVARPCFSQTSLWTERILPWLEWQVILGLQTCMGLGWNYALKNTPLPLKQ